MGKESSGEGKLEKTIGQHDGCLLGEIFFFFFPSRSPKQCKRVSSSKKRWVAFHKILFTCKISGHRKNYAKKGKTWGFFVVLLKNENKNN